MNAGPALTKRGLPFMTADYLVSFLLFTATATSIVVLALSVFWIYHGLANVERQIRRLEELMSQMRMEMSEARESLARYRPLV